MPTQVVALLLFSAVTQTPAPPAEVAPEEDKAAVAAGFMFAEGCLQTLSVVTSREDYARRSGGLSRKFSDEISTGGEAQIDGNGGRGCRVRYAGPHAEIMWKGFIDMAVPEGGPAADGGGCVTTERTERRFRAVCTYTDAKPFHRFALDVERSTAGSLATATASITYLAH